MTALSEICHKTIQAPLKKGSPRSHSRRMPCAPSLPYCQFPFLCDFVIQIPFFPQGWISFFFQESVHSFRPPPLLLGSSTPAWYNGEGNFMLLYVFSCHGRRLHFDFHFFPFLYFSFFLISAWLAFNRSIACCCFLLLCVRHWRWQKDFISLWST